MPRFRAPYLYKKVSRHGTVNWYVRIPGKKMVRISAKFGTPEFQEVYDAIRAGKLVQPKGKTKSGSLRWLWDQYRETAAWTGLSAATRRQRENIMHGVLASAGDLPFAAFSAVDIEAGKDKRRATPSQARNYLDAMRGLFRWAKGKHRDTDPTAEVGNPARPDTGGFPVWDEADVKRYYRKWQMGSRERVWLDVLLYTGLRRGDAVILGKQHVKKGGMIFLRTEKTGAAVSIRLLPVLAKTLKAGPVGDLTFIIGENGTSLTKESFGNLFRAAAGAAGVAKSAHGVRKLAATTMADNGATEAEMEAVFGWHGGFMAARYTKQANRKKLAQAATGKLVSKGRSIEPPERKVAQTARK